MAEEEFSYSEDTNISESISVEPHEELLVQPPVINTLRTEITKVGSFIRTKVITDNPIKPDTEDEDETVTNMQESIENDVDTAQAEKTFTPVTHVIFDLDGTLLDTESIYEQVITEIAAGYDREYSIDIQAQVMGKISIEASEVAVRLMNIPITAEEFDARLQAESVKKMANVKLMPGAERIIKHLFKNKIPIAVATSSSRPSYDLKSQRHTELFTCFDHIVTAGSDPEVTRGKPSPDIYLICAARFPDKPEPGNCLAVEDSLNGVKAAVSAGMQVVMVPSLATEPESGSEATLVLNSMEEFRPELFGLPKFDTQ